MTDQEKQPRTVSTEAGKEEIVIAVENGVAVNASGWRDQLHRQYGLLGLCGIALTVDNAWVALGSAISVSIRKKGTTDPNVKAGNGGELILHQSMAVLLA